MTRTGQLALLLLAVLVIGVAARLAWPSSAPALDCAPAEVRWADGRAVCGGEGARPPAGAVLTLGAKLDLNRASESDLALLPGVGPSLSKALVARREELGGFRDWDQVDEVAGVGAAKLEVLQRSCTLGEGDGGGPQTGL